MRGGVITDDQVDIIHIVDLRSPNCIYRQTTTSGIIIDTLFVFYVIVQFLFRNMRIVEIINNVKSVGLIKLLL